MVKNIIVLNGSPRVNGNVYKALKRRVETVSKKLFCVMMSESKMGIPKPLHKGKKAEIVTSCTTPFPFNYLCGQSSGAIRAVKEILKSSGFKIVKITNLAGTKKIAVGEFFEIPNRQM